MTDLIKAVDVSSHNPPSHDSLNEWIAAGCQLLLIHCYTDVEQAGLKDVTRQWVAAAREAGVWRMPYLWLFGTEDPVAQVRSALDTWRSCGETPTMLWLDCETYGDPVTDRGPSIDQILAAVDECHRQGVNAGIYSALWWLDGELVGDTSKLTGLPYWGAAYNGQADLESLWVPYQMVPMGHQYAQEHQDWSVFDLVALQRLAAGYTPPDPCQALRDGARAALAKLDEVRAELAALL